jgi:hypothetical protein
MLVFPLAVKTIFGAMMPAISFVEMTNGTNCGAVEPAEPDRIVSRKVFHWSELKYNKGVVA